jgi:hypothetical protein
MATQDISPLTLVQSAPQMLGTMHGDMSRDVRPITVQKFQDGENEVFHRGAANTHLIGCTHLRIRAGQIFEDETAPYAKEVKNNENEAFSQSFERRQTEPGDEPGDSAKNGSHSF